MVTKQEILAESRQFFDQKVKPAIQSRVPGAAADADKHWNSHEYQQLNDMLAQQTQALLVKHGIGGTHTGEPPIHVSPGQWTSVTQQHLTLATSKGVSTAVLQQKQTEHQAHVQAIWDTVFEQGLQEARSKGVSEAQLNAFRNDPQLHDLKMKFTQGVAGLVVVKVAIHDIPVTKTTDKSSP